MGRVNLLRASRCELPASTFVPYSHHVTPTILATRGGEYLSAWRLAGRAHEAASADEQARWVSELNNAWRGLADAGVAFWSHVVRRRATPVMRTRFDQPFCRHVDAGYVESLSAARFMENELYLTPVLRTVGDEVLEALGRREKEGVPAKFRRQQDGIARLDELNRALGSTLRPYGAELLATEARDRENGKVFSRPLEFLGLLVNGERLPVPVTRARFGNYLVMNRPLFGWHGEMGELRLTDHLRRFGIMEIVEYDGQGTTAADFDGLLRADFEFVLTQSFSALSRQAAKGFLERHKQRLLDAKDVAKSQIAEIDAALDQLMSGAFVMGEHHATLLAFGDTADEVRDHLAWARSELLDRGLVAKPVDLALEAAFWSQLPGNFGWRPRPMAVTSQNFLCFSPFHNFMSGKAAGNPWGPAVTVLRTASGTPLHFSFHASPPDDDSEGARLLGNTLILGQSGGGKTVLLGFLLAQAQKFRPTVVAFDKDRGLEIAIRAMGGAYLPLRSGEPTGWNPFQLEPTPANALFLKGLVKALAASGGAEVTHQDQAQIDRAVDTTLRLVDRADRRLSVLLQSLPDPVVEHGARPSVAARLRRWCEGGPYGWVFDNAEDRLDLTRRRVFGFDVTELLDQADARGPMMKYLLHRTEAMLDGRRFIYVFDEWWRALSGEDFAELTKAKGKTIRKQDGLLVLCTQEPDDALQSPVGKSVLQQCATFLLLRNPNATREDYVGGLKLSDPEFELVRGLPDGTRRFLVKQGAASALAELDLASMPEVLAVLSGTPDRARLVEALAQECGDAPERWLPKFWERVGVPARLREEEKP